MNLVTAGVTQPHTACAAMAAATPCGAVGKLMAHLIRVQLGLGGKGTVLGIVDTWKAVVGGKMGHRALLVGVLPRVCISYFMCT